MINHQHIRNTRIRILCSFLDQGGGKLTEMHNFMNRKLEEASLDPVGERTLQATIEILRSGDFNHSLQDLPGAKRKKLFKVIVVRKCYRWDSSSAKPVFGDLLEEERYTLPFIAAILGKYESIPAVRKVLSCLPELLGVSDSEMESSGFVIHSGPILYDGIRNMKNFPSRVVSLSIQILGHIHRSEWIEFIYGAVGKLSHTLNVKVHHRVAPLNIRFYDELYYLTAIDYVQKADQEYYRLLNFRIDQILNLRVDVCTDTDSEEILHFNPASLRRKFGLNHHFDHILGVWNFDEKAGVHDVHIKFKGWAAARLLKVKYHATQKIVLIDEENDFCIVSFYIKLYQADFTEKSIADRSPELAYLVGRFGKYAEILKAQPI